ncbi:MAG TPA: hypothetical protein VKW04_07555 [Planctomycetota bacterium]|nr:hypothetical protein [Planctomycetota bacterium]
MRSATLFLLFAGVLGAQDTYQPFSRACVVDGGEVRPGFTAQYIYEGTKYVVGFCCTGCRTKFLQAPAMYFGPALAAFKAGAPKREKKVAPDATGPCNLKHLIKVPWCVSCQRELAKEDVLPSKVCKKCETKPLLVEFCVKAGETEDRARVSYKCDSCAATSDLEAEFKHDDDCKRKGLGGLKKVCSKSGTAPHATEAK